MVKVPSNHYRQQDGCHNCANVFVYQEWEQTDRLFCMHAAPPRPLCDSVYLGEWREMKDSAEISLWETWREGREVQREGVCDAWQPAPAAESNPHLQEEAFL